MKYIFLHGLGQTSSSWQKTIRVMDEESEIACPDLFMLLQGREINYSNLYQVFSEYCNTYSEPINLCGLSLGGILALQYLIENPDRVHSAALIGTQYAMPKKLLKVQNMIFQIMPAPAFQKMGLDKRSVINLSASMMDLNFQQYLSNIVRPVLVLCGDKDKANLQASVKLAEMIPHAEFDVIPNAGHEINLDAPEALGAKLNAFFAR